MNEIEIIELFAKKLGLEEPSLDDVAVVNLGGKYNSKSSDREDIVFKCDMLVQSTDVPPQMRPWQIARKSLVSCVSDMVAKGIRPYVAMISIGIPRGYPTDAIRDLADGFKIASKEFGVKIVGGDTNECKEVVIDCSMIGIAGTEQKRKMKKSSSQKGPSLLIPTRSGAKPGDLVVVSGVFGYSASGLKILQERAKATGLFRRNAIQSTLKPVPKMHFGLTLAKYFSSSIDSSDGLAISLYEIAEKSRVDIVLGADKIPAPNGIKAFAKDNGLDANELIFSGGEEYEIVATISRTRIADAEQKARETGLKLYVIGKVQKKKGKKGKVFTLSSGGNLVSVQKKGYVHFQ